MKIIELDLIKSMSLSGGWIRSKEIKGNKNRDNIVDLLKAASKNYTAKDFMITSNQPYVSTDQTYVSTDQTYVSTHTAGPYTSTSVYFYAPYAPYYTYPLTTTTTTTATTNSTTYSTTINGYYA